MERIIKFRGREIGFKKHWCYGYYVVLDGQHWIVPFNAPCESELTDDWFEVDPKTVGLFTGLLDKNGKVIYEGDIMKTFTGVGAVEYKAPSFNVDGEYNEVFEGCHDNWEVIGNIHDSPELTGNK